MLVVDPDVEDRVLARLGIDGVGGALHPAVLLALAGPQGWIDSLDILLAARGRGGESPLVVRADLASGRCCARASPPLGSVQLFRPDRRRR